MHVTEVTITESNTVTRYAQYVPDGQVVEEWLKKLLWDVVMAPATNRMVLVAGTSRTLDRANITSITITRSA